MLAVCEPPRVLATFTTKSSPPAGVGTSIKNMKLEYSEKKVFKYGFILIALALLMMTTKNFFIGMLLAIAFAILIRPFKNFYNGQMAEYDVGDTLYKLPEGWHYDSNLILKNNGNIDYVVIGPTGIWVVEVKSHQGMITLQDGQLVRNGASFEKNFLKQVWAEAYALRDFLKEKLQRDFKIQPMLLFSSRGARLKFGKRPVNGVYIIGYDWLLDVLQQNTHQSLSPEIIELVTSTIRAAKENQK